MKNLFRKFVLYPLIALFGVGAIYAVAQDRFSVPAGLFTAGEVAYFIDNVSIGGATEVIASATGLKIGTTSGTELTQIRVYSQVITPAAVAALACTEEGFTVTGVTTSDKIIYNPSAAVSPFVVGVRAEATNIVGITFCNMNAGTQTPPPHTATFIAIRS